MIDMTDRAPRSRIKLAVLTNTIPAYRTPVFKALNEAADVELRIFLSLPIGCCDERARVELPLEHVRGINLNWSTHHRQVETVQTETLNVPFQLATVLWRYRPDIIVSGEFGLRSLAAYAVAKALRIPFLLWSEEIAESAIGISTAQKWLRSFLIPRATAFLAWGQPAVDYLRGFGVPPERIHYCAQAVDNHYWARQCARCSRENARTKLRVRGKLFLAVSRLVARKGLDRFLLAWARLPEPARSANTIILVGAGPEAGTLQELAAEQNLHNVVFAGARFGADLAEFYAAADVFVFPSLVDVWGLVVNEAMACGVPVLGSRFAGASQQLLTNENIGETFDPNDLEAFASMLLRWCTRTESVRRENVLAAVKDLDYQVTVTAFHEVMDHYARTRERATFASRNAD